MFLWALAGVPLGVYNISHNLHPALQVQAQILTALSLVTWAQCMYYNAVSLSSQSHSRSYELGADSQGWNCGKACCISASIGAVLAGIEVGLVFALRVGLGPLSSSHPPLTSS